MHKTYKKEKNLLIVDHSSLIIERLLNILKDVSSVKKIYTAANYTEALDSLKENLSDIVLLDIELPGKRGIELLKYITTDFPEVKVIIQTNLSSHYYQTLCKKLGVLAFIDKSKEFDLIPEIIAAIKD